MLWKFWWYFFMPHKALTPIPKRQRWTVWLHPYCKCYLPVTNPLKLCCSKVEPYGYAWQAGLRQGSRLVEICKVAVATLTHEQMIDLLRNSVTVRVVIIPPHDDATPRRQVWGDVVGIYVSRGVYVKSGNSPCNVTYLFVYFHFKT